MQQAIAILQQVEACTVDDGASDVVHQARVDALARVLVDYLGTDTASLLAARLTKKCVALDP